MERITVADVAETLGISEVTVRNMAEQGLLPFMAPTNRKDEKNRAGYVVFPHLNKLYVTGFDEPGEMAKELFLLGSSIKKEQGARKNGLQ